MPGLPDTPHNPDHRSLSTGVSRGSIEQCPNIGARGLCRDVFQRLLVDRFGLNVRPNLLDLRQRLRGPGDSGLSLSQHIEEVGSTVGLLTGCARHESRVVRRDCLVQPRRQLALVLVCDLV